MATDADKQALYDALKFTPRTYTIAIWGYGGEIVMGKVERKIFDYFKHRRLDLSDFAWNYEYAYDENIPEDMLPFDPGSWYDCSDMAHSSGANLDCGTIQILDEEGKTVIEEALEGIDGTTIQLSCNDEVWIGQANPGEVVFVGRSNEKGTFFEGEIELTRPFDPELLTICYDEIDGEEYVSSVEYAGIDIDNHGSNTNGKSSEFGLYLIKPDNSWEAYRDMDSINYPLTEWFPKKTVPVRPGNYLIKTADKNSYEYQALWTGSRWISSWHEDKPETEELKIKEWRGIAYDPDGDAPPSIEPTPEVKEVKKEIKLNADASWPF